MQLQVSKNKNKNRKGCDRGEQWHPDKAVYLSPGGRRAAAAAAAWASDSFWPGKKRSESKLTAILGPNVVF